MSKQYLQSIFYYSNRALRRLWIILYTYYCNFCTYIVFFKNRVEFSSVSTLGVPIVSISRNGVCKIGKNLNMNSGYKWNPIGRGTYCYLIVDKMGTLTIGNNVGMSNSSIYCELSITIEDNVLIGGGVCIYDTDFHPINSAHRDAVIHREYSKEEANTKRAPVIVRKNVFIGAHSIILKGVSIGENSIIGAGSVVTKNVPDNEIWAGSPAVFIRKINKLT